VQGGWWRNHFAAQSLGRRGVSIDRLDAIFNADAAVGETLPSLMGAGVGTWNIDENFGGVTPGTDASHMIGLLKRTPQAVLTYAVDPSATFKLDQSIECQSSEPSDLVELASQCMGVCGIDAIRQSFQAFVDSMLHTYGELNMVAVSLCPALALAASSALWQCFHVVPLHAAHTPWSSILPYGPPRRPLQAFLSSLSPIGPLFRPLRRAQYRTRIDRIPADIVLEWLDASRFLKQIRDSDIAVKKFARLIVGRAREHEYLETIRRAPYNGLRSARVRLDMTCMLLWRSFFTINAGAAIALYLFVDASPQWRGLEFYASTWDIFVTGIFWKRRLLPAISLPRKLYSSLGKAVAFLWQVFLLVGPSLARMRAVLAKIRSITTDMGAESNIIRTPDVLPSFMVYLGVHIGNARPGKWLLPNAVHIAGWRHKVDLLIQRGLCRLDFFPKFIERLKSLIAFVRDEGLSKVLSDDLRSRKLFGLDALIKAGRPPTFAKWRWGTLAKCTRDIGGWLHSLAANFDHKPFFAKSIREQMKSVVACFTREFIQQFWFVSWYMVWMDKLQSYGGTCICHAGDFADGKVGSRHLYISILEVLKPRCFCVCCLYLK
jgi:hypothetical protein